MVLDRRVHYLASVHRVLSAVVAPIQYCVDVPIKLVTELGSSLSSRQTLLGENASLRVQQLLLQARLQKLTALEEENRQLRALLSSSKHLANRRTAVAQLLAVATDPLVSEVVLDSGQTSGVYEGQPVLDASGIMGQVIQVGPLTSRVLLLTDLRSALSVQDMRSTVRGLIVGRGQSQNLALINVPETADVKVGDLFTSSGLDGRYPEGYPVGIVKTIQHTTGGQFAAIEITPSARLNSSQQVLLVWPQKKPTIDVPKATPPAKNNQKNKINKHLADKAVSENRSN